MTLRVLLNNPPVFDVKEPWYDTPEFGRTGLAYLAGYLRAHTDCEVRIVDSKLSRLDFPATAREIARFEPDVVGLTAFTNEIVPAAEMSRRIKETCPHVRTVIGGVHVTALPRRTLREFPTFDFCVYGEGEETFAELCAWLAGGRLTSIDAIAGVGHRRDGEVRINAPRPRILDLDAIPLPAWDLLPPSRTYFVQSARGCPFTCKFCMNPNGRFARQRSIANVLEELELLATRYRPRLVWYGDEIFTVDVERTKALLRAVIDARLHTRLAWGATTHVRFVDDELFGLMRASNAELIGFGIETGDEDTLKGIGKGTSIEMILRARDGARRAGVPITTYFILGQPYETRASIAKTIDLAVTLNPELPVFGLMVPYPGTEVARLAARGEAGYRLISQDWNDYNKQVGGALEFANLTRTQIELLQLWAYVKVFLWNGRLIALARFLWNYRVEGLAVLRQIAGRLLGGARAGGIGRRRAGPGELDAEDTATATDEWREWQVLEIRRAKAERRGCTTASAQAIGHDRS